MKTEQSSLFSEVEADGTKPAVAKSARRRLKPEPPRPPGFRYQENFLTESEEQTVADELAKLPFKPFDFHGYQGNRRVASFGLRYDYDRRAVEVAAPAPQFLEDLRARAAGFAGHAPEDIRQIGINEYRPGAGIGWHRDKPQFGDVIGVSLLSPVKMRFRKPEGDTFLRASKILAPRSIYFMSADSRRLWYHSTPPVDALRFSIMFRTLATPYMPTEDSEKA